MEPKTGHRLSRAALLVASFALSVLVPLCLGQDSIPISRLNLQVHGFVTQAAVYTSANNYLGLNTSAGNLGWTEAALNLSHPFSESVRATAQFHITHLGAFGGYTPTVDFLLVEYVPRPWISVRAGKIKIPWGLYNTTQDADVGYLWCLLPETIYGIDYRDTNLALNGVEANGRAKLPHHAGAVSYSAYWGYYTVARKDGYLASDLQRGLNFTRIPHGKTPGIDVRLHSPGDSFQLGASLMFYDSHGTLTDGSFYQPVARWPTVYARYTHKRLEFDAQDVKLVQHQTITLSGTSPADSSTDTRAWFVMGSYWLSKKLQVGSYYTRYRVVATDPTDPANYFHDTAVSARYDIDRHLYTKLEGHFAHGNALGLYELDNPNGLAPAFNTLTAKIGFSF